MSMPERIYAWIFRYYEPKTAILPEYGWSTDMKAARCSQAKFIREDIHLARIAELEAALSSMVDCFDQVTQCGQLDAGLAANKLDAAAEAARELLAARAQRQKEGGADHG